MNKVSIRDIQSKSDVFRNKEGAAKGNIGDFFTGLYCDVMNAEENQIYAAISTYNDTIHHMSVMAKRIGKLDAFKACSENRGFPMKVTYEQVKAAQ